MNHKILILGKGFIGSRLKEEFSCEISGTDIASFKDAQKLVNKFKPEIIINCIGHVGKNVDDCELDIDKTLISNTFVPLMLGEIAVRNNIRLVHLSSGCIYRFDYAKDAPIDEEKAPDFFELFYSRTKIYAEHGLKALSRDYPVLIVRPRIPLDGRPHPRNLLTKLIGFKRVIDVPNSVTYLPDFIRALKHLIEIKAVGIYNVVNKGALKYPELLDIYKKRVTDFNYQVIGRKDLNLVRTDLILSTKKLESAGFIMPDIHEVLEECVRNYLKY
jgi:dTDP-4-dehydrorhamnose reductase